jgi:SPX domain protein involved in polyphosphate accumulation
MKFARTLRRSIYPPWKDQYIDYDKLKRLLRESEEVATPVDPGDGDDWTEEDEGAFIEELVNVQLEKVHAFQAETYQKLRDRTSACETKLDPLAIGLRKDNEDGTQKDTPSEPKKPEVPAGEREKILKDTLKELDSITKEVNELEKYSRINYTGFLKAAKKHDRRRGHVYRVRPLLQVRLAALPFNKEDYSPMLYRLSAMYSFVRQSLDGKTEGLSFSDSQTGGETYMSYKCEYQHRPLIGSSAHNLAVWVHPENLLEVKSVILRQLPVLVYNPQTSKIAEGTQKDPTITSIYFDNPRFSLYTNKVDHTPDASSLRLRWYGQLDEKPEILLEKKTIKDGDASEERRFAIKEKYIEQFIKGEYKMERSVQKLQERSKDDPSKVEEFQKTTEDIQSFIKDNHLQPVLRANYSRTAFQIPGDDRVRISLDTDLALIREDAIDLDRPCRDPDDWHRPDIDKAQLEYPFSSIRKGEINRFPFALLEIKMKGKQKYEWVADLMNSHLVKEAPRFSKFVHGVAVLFEDYVNSFPFWISEVETDIRRNPQQAFEEEQERKAKAAEDEFAVGSLFGARASPAFKPATSSPVGSPAGSGFTKPKVLSKATAEMARKASMAAEAAREGAKDNSADEPGEEDERVTEPALTTRGLRSLFPTFSTSKYAQAHRQGKVALPPGVTKPTYWIKDQGPVRVEAKVWLANQRTFVKWQHVSVLLASLSLGLYNAAGATNGIARALAIVYTLIAVFTAFWGWAIYVYRSRLIEQRSGKDFDSIFGPIVVCVSLVVALCLNFGFKVCLHSSRSVRRIC